MAQRGFLGITIPKTEDEKLEQMAATVKLPKAQMARALLRAGQIMFKENPQLVLTYVPTSRMVE